MTQALNVVRWCFQILVRQQQDRDLVTQFNGLNIRTLFVEQEGGNIHWHLCMHGCRVFLHGLFFEDTQDVQCG